MLKTCQNIVYFLLQLYKFVVHFWGIVTWHLWKQEVICPRYSTALNPTSIMICFTKVDFGYNDL